MRRLAPTVLAFGVVSILAVISVAAVQRPKSPYPPATPQSLASPPASARRGEQLAMLGGCHDCHTPKLPNGQPDMSRALSGHPADAPLAPEVSGGVSANLMLSSWRGPWGLSLARNITPDKETGIGTWSVADFKRTLRTGIDPKGEVLMPPMPVMMYQNLPDPDLDALYAYLMSVKPIRNAVGRVTPPRK